MPPENEVETPSVNCECGKWIEISLRQAGSAVKCACGRRVEVPLEEEFQGRAKLLSATTVESRIHRLVKAGEIPVVGQCAHCGKTDVIEVMPAILECERAKVRSHYARSDGQTMWIPFVVTVTTYKEEHRVEVQGHDTAVPAPMCVCTSCQAYLRSRKIPVFVWAPFLLLPLGGVAAFFDLAVGVWLLVIGLMAGLSGFYLWSWLAYRTRQNALKEMLSPLPVYRQMMASYPDAVVLLSDDRA